MEKILIIGYNNEDNVATVYNLKQLDAMMFSMKCPLNNKPYDNGSSVYVHYDQNVGDLVVQTNLLCGKYIVNYDCSAQNDIYKSNCTLEINKN